MPRVNSRGVRLFWISGDSPSPRPPCGLRASRAAPSGGTEARAQAHLLLQWSRTLLLLAAAPLGCDSFEAPAASVSPAAAEEKARASAREAIGAVVKAAEAATASCTAGDLLWEADFDGNTVARHYSRPCLPERCTPSAADLDALRRATAAARRIVDADPATRLPSYLGAVSLAEAMVSFADTATTGLGAKDRAARLSGLSMHRRALVAAHKAIVPEATTPLEPPTLTASLAVDQPGGDPCKGWAMPKHCDVRAVRVPAEHKWRAAPPCIEVEAIKR